MSNFEQFKLNKQILNAISDLGYENPTEIQTKAIPLALAGHDLMGIAQTGTGKTAAFVLPLLMKLKYAQKTEPRALILAPTRELAIQIEEEVAKLAKYLDIRHVVFYGGVGITKQLALIENGIDLIVATPGRFWDIYKKQAIQVKDIKTLIIDEADRMMDMGFLPQVYQILEIMPQKKQKLLFSATMPDKVKELANDFLDFPEIIEVTPQATAAETVEQILYEIPNLKTKINFLKYLLEDKETFNRVLVFARTRKNAEQVYKFLSRKLGEEDVKVIHANKGQNTRINAMQAFKDGNIRILVSTDVSARGIDVNLVSHVINFDVPIIYEDYVHRIGRTGRAKQEGKAITFMNESEIYHIQKIEEIIKQEIPRKPLPEDLKIEETDFEEKQIMARKVDQQKRKEDPNFKGAFHQKKKKNNFDKRKVKNRKRKKK